MPRKERSNSSRNDWAVLDDHLKARQRTLPQALRMGYGAFAVVSSLKAPDYVHAMARANVELRKMFHK